MPGSGTTAVLLGALLVMGANPGPMMLEQRRDLFWGVVASMYIGNIFLLVLNLPLIPLIAKILDLPKPLLLSLILIFCMIGVYGMSFSVFDLLLLLGFGLVGLGMRLFGFPAAPLILALIIGEHHGRVHASRAAESPVGIGRPLSTSRFRCRYWSSRCCRLVYRC